MLDEYALVVGLIMASASLVGFVLRGFHRGMGSRQHTPSWSQMAALAAACLCPGIAFLLGASLTLLEGDRLVHVLVAGPVLHGEWLVLGRLRDVFFSPRS